MAPKYYIPFLFLLTAPATFAGEAGDDLFNGLEGAKCGSEKVDEDAEVRTCLLVTKPGRELRINTQLSIYKNKEFSAPVRALLATTRLVLHGYVIPRHIAKGIPGAERYDLHFEVGGAMGAGLAGLTSALISSKSGFRDCEGRWQLPHCKKKMRNMRWVSALTSMAVTAIAAGPGKEVVYDKMMGRGNPDFHDFAYTLAGGTLASFSYSFPINTLFRKK